MTGIVIAHSENEEKSVKQLDGPLAGAAAGLRASEARLSRDEAAEFSLLCYGNCYRSVDVGGRRPPLQKDFTHVNRNWRAVGNESGTGRLG